MKFSELSHENKLKVQRIYSFISKEYEKAGEGKELKRLHPNSLREGEKVCHYIARDICKELHCREADIIAYK